MYAHQVIEDLLREREFYKASNIEAVTALIMESIKFNFGTVDGLPGMNDNKLNLFSLIKTHWRQPFKTCWFDGTSNITPLLKLKIGILSVEKEDKTILNLFCNSGSGWGWLTNAVLERCLEREVPYSIYMRQTIKDSQFPEVLAQGLVSAFFRFLLLLNCKNISTIKVKAPDALNLKRSRKGLTPLFSYHTLKINLGKERYIDLSRPSDIHNRLHLQRGHFKEYTAKAPLFGKYVGLFWWQPHVRGQNKDGIVMKDYEVKAQPIEN